MEGEEDMIIKTKQLKSAIEFLNKNPIINLNIIGFLENELDVDVYVDDENSPRRSCYKRIF